MSSDARRDADRWLLWYAGGEQLTEDGRKNAVRTATLVIRALLAAGPEAPPPPSDAVREAAEVLDSLVNRVWSMTPEEAESAGLPTIAKVLRASKRLLSALAASPATVTVPDDAAVREAAEVVRRLVKAMSRWGADEDGIPAEAFDSYNEGRKWLAARGGE